ncbi:hypothetical protein ND23_004981 [Escherichia coli]|nr:hypothetical protein [Escherichia coli]
MKDLIYLYIKLKNFTNTPTISKEFNISSYQARHYLLQLVDSGKIRRSPPQRGAKTVWENVDPSPLTKGEE